MLPVVRALTGPADGPLADNNFGDTLGPGVAGPIAFLFILVLAIATALLVRNMNARLRRLPREFPPESASTPDDASGEPRTDNQTR